MAEPTPDFQRQLNDAHAQLMALAASLRGENGQLLSDILNRNPHLVAVFVHNYIENLVNDWTEDDVIY